MGKKQSSSFWHSRRRSASAPATPRAAAPEPPLGCMSMVHFLIFAPGAGCVGRPPSASHGAVVAPHNNYHHHDDVVGNNRRRDSHDKEKRGGFEAPRNSLELDADNLNDIPIGVQIEPVFDALACRKMRAKATAPSSEADTPRTPSLVARLMGIDGLPENQSLSPAQQKKPRSSSASSPASSSEKKKRVIPESLNRREPLRSLSCNVTRSLPETPRGSTTSARASWEGARQSLQALKENVLDKAAQYMSLPTSPTSAAKKTKKKKQDNKENRERTSTAKEIIRQAKENVASRKAAAAVQKQSAAAAPDNNKENVSPAIPVRKDKLLALVVQTGGNKQPSPAPASKLAPSPSPPRVPLAPKHPPPPPPPQRAKPSRPPPPPPPLDTPTRAKKPDGCERFATRAKKPPPPPGATVGCLSPASSPCAPPAPATQLPSRHAATAASKLPLEEDPEYSYLRTVLERGGFMRTSPPGRPFKGHSVASPVDPIVFHLLELELPADEARLGPLRHRWNRKLMFHVAQEILADLLLDATRVPRGAPLLARVWRRVRSFPAADCRVVGDIDALVATDLASASVRRLGDHPAVAEEAADVADELAERVLDGLLGECVSVAEESLSLSLSSLPGSRWSPSRAVVR
ncbi:hypothetical protein EJB05_46899, partial [Eragrostis curvula]